MLDVDIIAIVAVLAQVADDRLEALKLIVGDASGAEGCAAVPAFDPEIGAILDQTVDIAQTRSLPIKSLAVAILTASW
jgi:hypothetical protein